MKFKVGDSARYTGNAIHPNLVYHYHKFIGQEVVILKADPETLSRSLGLISSYEINIPGYEGTPTTWTSEQSLEPLQKRPELGSIEELSKILGGWKPNERQTKREMV